MATSDAQVRSWIGDVAAVFGWRPPTTEDGFWYSTADGPVHEDDLLPFLLREIQENRDEILRLRRIIDTKLHKRRCHDCGHEFYAALTVIPHVLCDECGSQDTRKIKESR